MKSDLTKQTKQSLQRCFGIRNAIIIFMPELIYIRPFFLSVLLTLFPRCVNMRFPWPVSKSRTSRHENARTNSQRDPREEENNVDFDFSEESPLLQATARQHSIVSPYRWSPPPVHGGVDSAPILLPNECVIEVHDTPGATLEQMSNTMYESGSERKISVLKRTLKSVLRHSIPGMAARSSSISLSLSSSTIAMSKKSFSLEPLAKCYKTKSHEDGQGPGQRGGRVLVTTQRLIFIPSSQEEMGFSVFVVKLETIAVMRSAKRKWYFIGMLTGPTSTTRSDQQGPEKGQDAVEETLQKEEETNQQQAIVVCFNKKIDCARFSQVARNVMLEHKLAQYLTESGSSSSGSGTDIEPSTVASMTPAAHLDSILESGYDDKLPSFLESEKALFKCAKQAGVTVSDHADLTNTEERQRVLSQLALRI